MGLGERRIPYGVVHVVTHNVPPARVAVIPEAIVECVVFYESKVRGTKTRGLIPGSVSLTIPAIEAEPVERIPPRDIDHVVIHDAPKRLVDDYCNGGKVIEMEVIH